MGNNITLKLKYKESVVKFSYKYGVTKASIKFKVEVGLESLSERGHQVSWAPEMT